MGQITYSLTALQAILDGTFITDENLTQEIIDRIAGDAGLQDSINAIIQEGTTASNGLTVDGSDIKLGGVLTEETWIGGEYNLNINVRGDASLSGRDSNNNIYGIYLDGSHERVIIQSNKDITLSSSGGNTGGNITLQTFSGDVDISSSAGNVDILANGGGQISMGAQAQSLIVNNSGITLTEGQGGGINLNSANGVSMTGLPAQSTETDVLYIDASGNLAKGAAPVASLQDLQSVLNEGSTSTVSSDIYISPDVSGTRIVDIGYDNPFEEVRLWGGADWNDYTGLVSKESQIGLEYWRDSDNTGTYNFINLDTFGAGLNTSNNDGYSSFYLETERVIASSSHAGFTGIEYNIDFSDNYTLRSLVDKEYSDSGDTYLQEQINALPSPVLQDLQSVLDEGSSATITGNILLYSTNTGNHGIEISDANDRVVVQSGGDIKLNADDSIELNRNTNQVSVATSQILMSAAEAGAKVRLESWGNSIDVANGMGTGDIDITCTLGKVNINSTNSTFITGGLTLEGNGEGVVMHSPDGTEYLVTVANGGTLTVTAV